MFRFALSLAVCALSAHLASAAQCLDESGSPVDWWVVIKRPTGSAYSYADANTNSFSLSPNTLQGSKGAVTFTLQKALGESYAMYNDEPSDKSPLSYDGHTKGFAAVSNDASEALWLVHSVPKWPTPSTTYAGFPETETDYGQAMLCITMDGSQLETVADAWLLTRPQFYGNYLSSTVQDTLPKFSDVVSSHTHYSPAASNVTTITSSGGTTFTLFAKNSAWGQDLYNALVSPFYGADTWTETWQNGVNPDPNFCPPSYKYATYNIQSYTLNGFTMGDTSDHSKWAVLDGHYTMCIGGINRQQSQAHRGGGTVCFVNGKLSNELKAGIQFWTDGNRGGCSPPSDANLALA